MDYWTRNCEEQYNGEKNSLFSTNGAGAMGHPYTKIIVIIWTHRSYSHHNKMDHRPNDKCRTTKFLEDNIGNHREDLGYGDAFLGTTPKSWLINWTSLKLKTALWKALSREWKHKPQGRRKYLPKTVILSIFGIATHLATKYILSLLFWRTLLMKSEN